MRKLTFIIVFKMMAISVFTGCGANEHPSQESLPDDSDLLYKVGDSTLTISRVIARMPRGLEAADSAALFQTIANDWLYTILLEKEAKLNLGDYEAIEAQVRQYRRHLLAARYREKLADAGDEATLNDDSVRSTYNRRAADYKLTAPMVKGILLQLPANNPHLAGIRALIRKPTMANIDSLEKLALDEALQYEYFIDDWQDWRDIAALVPYRFPSGNNYVARHPFLETQHKESVYLLTITDHLPSGAIMPYEKAAPLIRASLLRRDQKEADLLLLESLRKKNLASGVLKEYKH